MYIKHKLRYCKLTYVHKHTLVTLIENMQMHKCKAQNPAKGCHQDEKVYFLKGYLYVQYKAKVFEFISCFIVVHAQRCTVYHETFNIYTIVLQVQSYHS